MRMVLSSCFALIFLLASCGNSSSRPDAEPFAFDVRAFDSISKAQGAIVDAEYRSDSTLFGKRYYLADTAKVILEFNRQEELQSVHWYNGKGQELWQEIYYPSGQRMARFGKQVNQGTGAAFFHGPYKSYYPDGSVKECGEYGNNQLLWNVHWESDGRRGDTIIYEYR